MEEILTAITGYVRSRVRVDVEFIVKRYELYESRCVSISCEKPPAFDNLQFMVLAGRLLLHCNTLPRGDNAVSVSLEDPELFTKIDEFLTRTVIFWNPFNGVCDD